MRPRMAWVWRAKVPTPLIAEVGAVAAVEWRGCNRGATPDRVGRRGLEEDRQGLGRVLPLPRRRHRQPDRDPGQEPVALLWLHVRQAQN